MVLYWYCWHLCSPSHPQNNTYSQTRPFRPYGTWYARRHRAPYSASTIGCTSYMNSSANHGRTIKSIFCRTYNLKCEEQKKKEIVFLRVTFDFSFAFEASLFARNIDLRFPNLVEPFTTGFSSPYRGRQRPASSFFAPDTSPDGCSDSTSVESVVFRRRRSIAIPRQINLSTHCYCLHPSGRLEYVVRFPRPRGSFARRARLISLPSFASASSTHALHLR